MSDETNTPNEGAEEDAWYDKKSELMGYVLGKEADWVMHAIIPYAIGGGLDEYYYSSPKTGTALVTKELSLLPDQGSSNDRLTSYELVMFTRAAVDQEGAQDEHTDFGKARHRISSILNTLAPYSEQATLNRHETCELPEDHETAGGAYLLFDEFAFKQENGSHALIDLLKSEGVYPFSDPERTSVV